MEPCDGVTAEAADPNGTLQSQLFNLQPVESLPLLVILFQHSLDHMLNYLQGIIKQLYWMGSPSHTPWRYLCLQGMFVIRGYLKWIGTEFALSRQNEVKVVKNFKKVVNNINKRNIRISSNTFHRSFHITKTIGVFTPFGTYFLCMILKLIALITCNCRNTEFVQHWGKKKKKKETINGVSMHASPNQM